MYPGRVKAIRYEDGAMEPQTYTSGIYKFLGLEITEDVRRYITEITSTKPQGGNTDFSVSRDDPSRAMQRWRYKTKYKDIAQVDHACYNLYPLLGYRSITSQADLESNKSIILSSRTTKTIF